MYGATVRNHGTKVCGKKRLTVGSAVCEGSPRAAAILSRASARSVPGQRVAARADRRSRIAGGRGREDRGRPYRREPAEARVDRLGAGGEVGLRRREAVLDAA